MTLDFLNWQSLATLVILVGLELVLGIDNILIISLVVAPLPLKMRHRARRIGLLLALLLRLFFITGVFSLVTLTKPWIATFSARDLLLLCGGTFLMVKGIFELNAMLNSQKKDSLSFSLGKKALAGTVLQIVMLDLLFSIDSVITAVGLTRQLFIIVVAVIISFIAVLCYVGPIGEFILNHPSLKILALTFLVVIGGNLVLQGLGYMPSEELIYGAMGFAVFVELLQMIYKKNHIHSE